MKVMVSKLGTTSHRRKQIITASFLPLLIRHPAKTTSAATFGPYGRYILWAPPFPPLLIRFVTPMPFPLFSPPPM